MPITLAADRVDQALLRKPVSPHAMGTQSYCLAFGSTIVRNVKPPRVRSLS